MDDLQLTETVDDDTSQILLLIQQWFSLFRLMILFMHQQDNIVSMIKRIKLRSDGHFHDYLARRVHLEELIYASDSICIAQLRMDRHAFKSLCQMLEDGGRLKDNKHLLVEEQVAMFLHILAHHVKNRVIRFRFHRSGETISRHFRSVLNAVIRLHSILFRSPEPILEGCTDERWKWFKNCIGALDGTYIKVKVSPSDRPRYRTRKGEVAQNVLAACSPDEQFIYVLAGWEGSSADSRVLRDAMSRANGLKVPIGQYYLVDAGYPNAQGFLAPYRGQRYHLNEWREGYRPTTAEEYFNFKHASARNVIERCFGQLKGRWAILRSPSFYPIQIQAKIVLACCLLHNHIKRCMDILPEIEDILIEDIPVNGQNISVIESSNEWTVFREHLASTMFSRWNRSRQEDDDSP